jgi:small GTP-binding protein
MRILTPEQQALVAQERQVLASLRDALVELQASPEAQDALARSIEQLDELFLLVVVGEFNSGKSAFINALLGQRLLKEGVTPTTAQVNILQYAAEPGRTVKNPHLHLVTAPVELLREIHIVDTPGTNAVIREHEAITAEFVPRSDLVLFVTSADRPFTESERLFLEAIRGWGKKIVIVLNKVDLLEREEELHDILKFVQEHAHRLLGVTPEIFPVSARQALRAKEGDQALWASSRFEALERYIHERLDERERLRLKLSNPVGVANSLTSRYLGMIGERLELLADDLKMLDDVDRQLAVYEQDMHRQYELRFTEIEKVLLEMEQRGHLYFDEMLRIGRVFDLFNKARVQEGFEREVVGDAPQKIERRVSELIDWLVASDLRQWQSVTNHLAERRRQYRDRIVGDADLGGFDVERTRLIDSVGREAQRVVDTYDRRREAEDLAEKSRTAVAAAAAVGASALGLGAIVTAAATTAAADVTGLLAAGVVAAVGLFIIPTRRRKAKADMNQKVTRMRETLSRALRSEFEQALGRSAQRISDSIGPYSRFVRAEQASLSSGRDRLERLRDDLNGLLARIDALVPAESQP